MEKIINETDLTNPVYLEKKRIEKRKSDGVEAYHTTQAELRLSRLANGISDAVYTENVYTPMSGVINRIATGNWLDAYNVIGSVISNTYLTAAMLLSFKNKIANYIVAGASGGDYGEYTGKIVDPLTGLIKP